MLKILLCVATYFHWKVLKQMWINLSDFLSIACFREPATILYYLIHILNIMTMLQVYGRDVMLNIQWEPTGSSERRNI